MLFSYITTQNQLLTTTWTITQQCTLPISGGLDAIYSCYEDEKLMPSKYEWKSLRKEYSICEIVSPIIEFPSLVSQDTVIAPTNVCIK